MNAYRRLSSRANLRALTSNRRFEVVFVRDNRFFILRPAAPLPECGHSLNLLSFECETSRLFGILQLDCDHQAATLLASTFYDRSTSEVATHNQSITNTTFEQWLQDILLSEAFWRRRVLGAPRPVEVLPAKEKEVPRQ